jgi:hypothetical protein
VYEGQSMGEVARKGRQGHMHCLIVC